ncbi:MAG: hypothetical protein ACYC99_09405 [Candidatus Geothermincolia bacterium]
MRKLTVVAVLLVVCLAVALAAGCGGDTKQAQQYMQAADAQYQKLAADSNQLATKITAAFADASDPAKLQAAVTELNTFLAGMDTKADAATAEYNKIKSLKGAANYVKYAELQTELMSLIKQATAKLKTLMAEIVAAVKAGDTATLQALQSSFEPTFTALSDKITKLEDEASKFKAENKL